MVLLQFIADTMSVKLGTALVLCFITTLVVWESFPKRNTTVPVSVNYHFARKCNRTCGFCFHTEKVGFRDLHIPQTADSYVKNSFMLDIDSAKRGLSLLKAAGMRKINFAGGEPFL